MIKTYNVHLDMGSPLLINRMTEDAVVDLMAPKGAKKKIKFYGTPREEAEKKVYRRHDGVCMFPTENIVQAFKYAAAEYKQGNSRKSFKTIAASIFTPTDEFIPLKTKSGKEVLDFEVDIRRGNNFQAGAICVCRPRFDDWSLEFDVELDTDLIDETLTLQILQEAGRRSGLGSFRIANGGRFGKFYVTSFKEFKRKERELSTKVVKASKKK